MYNNIPSIKNYFIFIFIILSSMSIESARSQELGLGADIDSASSPLSLAQGTAMQSILVEAGLSLHHYSVGVRIEQEFNRMLSEVGPEISDKSGFLIKVRIYDATLNGQIYFPNGEMILPIGIDTTPMNAMSTYFMSDQVTNVDPPRAKWRNSSYYVWVTAETVAGVTTYTGWTIPKEFRRWFEGRALAVASRRVQMRQFFSYINDIVPTAVRANYWRDRFEETEEQFSSNERRKRVERLIDRYEVAQRQVNKAISDYKAALNETKKASSFWRAIDGAQAIVGLLNQAVNVGELIYNGSGPVTTTDTTSSTTTSQQPSVLKEQRESTQATFNFFINVMQQNKVIIDNKTGEMREIEGDIQYEHNYNGIQFEETDMNSPELPPIPADGLG